MNESLLIPWHDEPGRRTRQDQFLLTLFSSLQSVLNGVCKSAAQDCAESASRTDIGRVEHYLRTAAYVDETVENGIEVIPAHWYFMLLCSGH